MAQLADLLRSTGYADAQTFLQSGNVVMTADRGAVELRGDLERSIRARFALDVPVLVRTRDELEAVVTRNPFPRAATDGSRFYVVFLADEPPSDRIAELHRTDVSPDEWAMGERVIYAWYRNGLHRSRLAQAISDRRLGVTTTARNWNTVTRLLRLAARLDEA